MPKKILLIPFILGLVLIGFGISGTGPLISSIAREFAVSPNIVGRVFFFQGLGYFFSLMAAGFLGDMIPQDKVLRVGLTIALGGFMGISLLSSFTTVVVFFLISGVGLGFLDCMTNPAATSIFTRNPGTVLNVIHAFFGLGSFTAPWLFANLTSAGFTWQSYYTVVAVFTLVTLVSFLPSFIPRRATPSNLRELVKVFRKKAFWFMGATMIFYSGGVTILNGWMVTYLIERGWPEGTAALFLSNFWLGLFAGRFLLSRLSDRIGHLTMIRINSTGGIVLTALAVFLAPGAWSTPVLLFMGGFLLSTTIPTTLAFAVVNYPDTAATASGWVMFNNGFGIFLFPWLGGIIGSIFGFHVTLGLVPVFLLVMLVFQQLLARDVRLKTA